jgi:hypothetical protein
VPTDTTSIHLDAATSSRPRIDRPSAAKGSARGPVRSPFPLRPKSAGQKSAVRPAPASFGNCTRTCHQRPAGAAAVPDPPGQVEPPFVSGTQFDAEFRTLGTDGSELLSDCVTVTVK